MLSAAVALAFRPLFLSLSRDKEGRERKDVPQREREDEASSYLPISLYGAVG